MNYQMTLAMGRTTMHNLNKKITFVITKTAFVLLFLLSSFSSVFAQNFDFIPDSPQGMVNDYAGMLSSSEERRLDQKLVNYRDTTTNVIAIAIIESLEGNSIEEVATEVFSRWRMWEGDNYNGVLILVSEGDRAIRIEVGYGLEGAIPDVMANRIINDIITPSFRNQDVYGGLDRATGALIQLASGEFTGTPEGLSNNDGSGIPIDVIIFLVVLILLVISRSGRGGRGGKRTFGPTDVVEVLFWNQVLGGGGRNRGAGFGSGGGSFGGGGGFGGFSGGGGFGSGGGGASGGW
ncbi:MAG: TPM domain-containing protein [Balneolaceae bacterium]